MPDLVPRREFAEQGALRGAALRSPEAGFSSALRDRQYCASQPDLAGFDVVAVHMASRQALVDLAAKGDRLAIGQGPIQDRGPDEAAVDVPDPDGTVLRFLWERENEKTVRFTGLSFDAGRPPTFYDTLRLRVPETADRATSIDKGRRRRVAGPRPAAVTRRSALCQPRVGEDQGHNRFCTLTAAGTGPARRPEPVVVVRRTVQGRTAALRRAWGGQVTSQGAGLLAPFPGVVAFDGQGCVMALLSATEINAGVAGTDSPAPAYKENPCGTLARRDAHNSQGKADALGQWPRAA